MRGLQKNTLKKHGRKGLSLVLVATMVLTLIPETAFAAQTETAARQSMISMEWWYP